MDALCLITDGFICSPDIERLLVENIGINIEALDPNILVNIQDQIIDVDINDPIINLDVLEDTNIEISVEVNEPIINIGVCNELNN